MPQDFPFKSWQYGDILKTLFNYGEVHHLKKVVGCLIGMHRDGDANEQQPQQ
jgi:hypothetical protein